MGEEAKTEAPKGTTILPSKAGEPLQVVKLCLQDKCVVLDDEALEKINAGLQATGASKLAVLSVMGAYRTGKSFLLDIFLRYLSKAQPAAASRTRNDGAGLPSWLAGADKKLAEGKEKDGSAGFLWRPGMQKCTEGIWIWSQPFVLERDGEKVAVLLMDTQGAWDSQLSKEDSAVIFGLTSIISSKQIYNISKQIDEAKVENLACFVEHARRAMRAHDDDDEAASASKAIKTSTVDEADVGAPFQTLEFLVRDWANFEDEWSLEECRAQMKEHLAQHTDPDVVKSGNETVNEMRSLFQEMACFCLPHPGMVIEKKSWEGDLSKLEDDFVVFLDTYVRETFQQLPCKQILGQDLRPSTFSEVFKSFVRAFKDAKPIAMPIQQALAFSNNLQARETALEAYKGRMEQIAKAFSTGKKPEDFEEDHKVAKEHVLKLFSKQANFGKKEDIDASGEALRKSIDEAFVQYEEQNKRRLEQVLIGFGQLSVVGLVLFLIDFVSNYTCDWWLQACVEMSKLLFFSYMAIFGYVGMQVAKLYKERGKLAATLAGYELGKECMKQSVALCEQAQEHLKHPEEWQALGKQWLKQLLELYEQNTKPAGDPPKKEGDKKKD